MVTYGAMSKKPINASTSSFIFKVMCRSVYSGLVVLHFQAQSTICVACVEFVKF